MSGAAEGPDFFDGKSGEAEATERRLRRGRNRRWGERQYPPHLPLVRALPDGWRGLSEGAKIEHLLNMDLDRCWQWLSLEREEMDNGDKNCQIQVMRVVLMIAAKVGIEGSRRAGEREKILARMVRDLPDGKGGK